MYATQFARVRWDVSFCAVIVIAVLFLMPLVGHAREADPPFRVHLPIYQELRMSGSATLVVPIIGEVENISATLSVRGHEVSGDWRSHSGIDSANPDGNALHLPISGLEDGRFELKVDVHGDTSSGPWSDSQLRLIEVNGNRARVVSVHQWEREQMDQRREEFESLWESKDPLTSIRMLSPPLVEVDPEVVVDSIVEDEPGLLPRAAELNPQDAPYIVDRSADVWRKQDPITVRGRMVFEGAANAWPFNKQQTTNRLHPLVGATIYVYDDDVLVDEFLGSTVTDSNGNWSLSVNGDDGFAQDGRDIYFVVDLINSRVRTGICHGATYSFRWRSPARNNIPDGSTVNFGLLSTPPNHTAPILFHRMLKMWRFVVDKGGKDPGYTSICRDWAGTFYEKALDRIHVPASRMNSWGSVGHEYGHFLMDMAYGPDPSWGGPHRFTECNQDRGLAWSEGWATAFSAIFEATQSGRPVSGPRNIENFGLTCKQGDRSEARVSTAIYDLWDADDDLACRERPKLSDSEAERQRKTPSERLGRPGNSLVWFCDNTSKAPILFKTMYAKAMWGNYHPNVTSYFRDLRNELSKNTASIATNAFEWNWMPKLVEGQGCVATSVIAKEHEEGESLLTGLRDFRNLVLEPGETGQIIAKMYYRHSPELAWILVHRDELRHSARIVAEYAAAIGHGIRADGERTVLLREPVLPQEVADAVQELLHGFRELASDGLLGDLDTIERLLKQFDGLNWLELIDVVEDIDRRRAPEAPSRGVRDFMPRSQEIIESKELDDFLGTSENGNAKLNN